MVVSSQSFRFEDMGRHINDPQWWSVFNTNLTEMIENDDVVFGKRLTPGVIYALGREVRKAVSLRNNLHGVKSTNEVVKKLSNQHEVNGRLALNGIRLAIKDFSIRKVSSVKDPMINRYDLRANLKGSPPLTTSESVVRDEKHKFYRALQPGFMHGYSHDYPLFTFLGTFASHQELSQISESYLSKLNSMIGSTINFGPVRDIIAFPNEDDI